MKIVRRDPGVGYLDSELWLPKSNHSELQIRAALSFVTERQQAVLAWREEPHHFRVPRNFFQKHTLAHLPYTVVDSRFKDFPKIDLKSYAVMDFMDPRKTVQRDAAAALLKTEDGILCLRCGMGKTVVALHAATMRKTPFLIIVSDKGLARQWLEEIETHLRIPANEVGRIGGDGAPFDWERPIAIATVQTLAKRAAEKTLPPEMLTHFGVIIPDEAHLMGAPYFNSALPPFPGDRWALTATPTREDAFDGLLKYTVGNIVYSYLEPDLRSTFIFKRLATRPNFANKDVYAATHDTTKNLHFMMLYGYFATDPVRTAEITDDIRHSLSLGRQVLVLTHSRDMCEVLAKPFPEAGVIHSDVPEGARIRLIRERNPVISIIQLGKQALNKPKLDTVYMCEPTTKAGALQQIKGRAERPFTGKLHPLIIVIEDVNIRPLMLMCNKIRKTLARWPAHKGGAIPFKIIKAKETP